MPDDLDDDKPDHASTCFHEAGHAVVYWALINKVPDAVEINADGSGRLVHRTHPDLTTERTAVLSAAGAAAELRYEQPDSHGWEFAKRYIHVVVMLVEDKDDDETSDLAYFAAARRERHVVRRTLTLIDQHWDRVERLATALIALTKQTAFQAVSLNRDEIAEILGVRCRP